VGPPLPAREALYVVVSPTAPTAPPIPARGYASRAGRIDVVARVFTEARPGSAAAAVLQGPPGPPVTLVYDPGECVLEGERQAVAEIARALAGSSRCVERVEAGLPEALYWAQKLYSRLVLLDESGPPLSAARVPTAYFMGAHVDMREEDRRLVARAAEPASIGPLPYHSEHVVAYLEWARLACHG